MNTELIHRILRYLTTGRDQQSKAEPSSVSSARSRFTSFILSNNRRGEERFPVRGACSYELVDNPGSESPVIHYGQAHSINVSTDGILLLLDRQPQLRQLIEIHNPASPASHLVTLFEVRWTNPVPIGSATQRHLVGCRLTFGQPPYFLLQQGSMNQPLSGWAL